MKNLSYFAHKSTAFRAQINGIGGIFIRFA